MKENNFIKEEDIEILTKKCARMKADILFEEPCPIYEGDDQDWDDFWFDFDR